MTKENIRDNRNRLDKKNALLFLCVRRKVKRGTDYQFDKRRTLPCYICAPSFSVCVRYFVFLPEKKNYPDFQVNVIFTLA